MGAPISFLRPYAHELRGIIGLTSIRDNVIRHMTLREKESTFWYINLDSNGGNVEREYALHPKLIKGWVYLMLAVNLAPVCVLTA